MHILLTNDDGIFAPGLAAIYKNLTRLGKVTVVAPANGQSGTSHSITFTTPLICSKIEIPDLFTGYSVQGSPADCVKLACMQLCDQKPDLLVSGINSGANAGINIYYSGTVAAAMEAAFMKIPSVSMSLALEKDMNFQSAANHCFDVLQKILPLQAGNVININIPWLSKGKPKGIRVVPQSTEGFSEYYIPKQNEFGQTLYQLAGGPHRHETTPTDTTSIADGYITVTALAIEMTDPNRNLQLKSKLDKKSKIE